MNELATHPIVGIELFSGTGMLGEGFRAGLEHLGIPYRAACHVEREAYPAAVLVSRMEEGSIPQAPIWSDVTTFEATAWRGKVDCVVAGFPCTDLSVAGKRAGLDGKRSGLFFEVTRIATDCGAWLMLLENVAGIATATATVVDEAIAAEITGERYKPAGDAMGEPDGVVQERAAARVVGELADLGWNAEWITISASEVGASHGRARWFCLAWKGLYDAKGWSLRRDQQDEREIARNGDGITSASEPLGNTEHTGWNAAEICKRATQGNDCYKAWEVGSCESSRSSDTDGQVGHADQQRAHRSGTPGQRTGSGESAHDGIDMADTSSTRPQRRELGTACDGDRRRQEAHRSASQLCGLFAPGPSDPRWAGIIREHPELSPALEPTFRGVVNGLAFDLGDSRAQRLKCAGNGVVAAQAGCAVVELVRRAGIF